MIDIGFANKDYGATMADRIRRHRTGIRPAK